jgi:hypothetical protein
MKKKYADGGMYTEKMGQPPQDIDGGSAPAPKPMKRPAPKPAMKRATKRPMSDTYTAEMGQPPQDIDGGSAPMKKYAKGGSVSSRADGIAKKGKTHCKMV